ncbi:MAG: VWA domain-containing protein [Myxococcales bacterium]|nr:VWA domain-containing protein [Myxococcales bacterium]
MRNEQDPSARARWAGAMGLCALVAANDGRATGAAAPAPDITEGRLTTRDHARVVDVPLEHTEVVIHATAHLAEVQVAQTFTNPYDHKIEAVYLFPLPTGAAVNALEIRTGDRVIRGEIARRADARATYVKAARRGFVAALLTQERPNLFTQRVANLEPGAQVIVQLTYVEPLRYDDGGYELVFPMVAGPRYLPATATAADADQVQPTALPPGTRSSHDVGLTVTLDAGVALKDVRSPSHQLVRTAGATAARATITLAPGDTIPNKDFVLRYDVAGAAPEAAVLAHRTGAGPGAFLLTVTPPAAAAPAQVTPRELVFVLDTSSSMRGQPLAKARALVRAMLTSLAPDDTFQIVRFADVASALGDRPIASKPRNVEYALAWLDALEAGGGTAVTEGVAAALDLAHDPLRLRLVVFITDGYVGDEDEILATVRDHLGPSRLYSFGVGTAVNRYLLEEMASFGRGAVQIIRPDEDTAAAVARFHDRIARPVLTDITIDWGGLAVADVTPAAVPDLFVGQPVVVAGHYPRAGAGTVVIRGQAAGRPVAIEVPVELPATADQPAIATVWARARIAELTRAEVRGATEATRGEITQLALDHHLLSRYTALVAVDRARTTAGGDAAQVVVPVEVPEGLHATSGGGWGVSTGGFGAVGYGAGGGGSGFGTSSGSVSVHLSAAGAPARVLSPPTPTPVAQRVVADDPHELELLRAALRTELAATLATRPAVAGTYRVRVVITASGTVRLVAIVAWPAGADAALRARIRAVARDWAFGPASAERTLETTVEIGGGP